MITPGEHERLMQLAERVSDKAKALGRAEEDDYFGDTALAEEAHDEAWLAFRDELDALKDKQ